MWKYEKRLQYPVNIKKKDLQMAKYLVTQYGGSNGEMAAALRYLNQRYTMPDEKGKALLTDIGTEELAHIEMICTMIYQLTKDATIEELRAAGLGGHYAEHNKSLYPTDANGPIPYGKQDFFQQRIIGVNRSALSHGQMVRRIKAGCADVTPCAGIFSGKL